MVTELQEKNEEASLQCEEIVKKYKEKTVVGMRSQSDLFSMQREFIEKALQQTQVQRILAKEAFRFLAVAISTEIKRSQVIKKEIKEYFQLYEELTDSKLMSAESSLQLEKSQERELIA